MRTRRVVRPALCAALLAAALAPHAQAQTIRASVARGPGLPLAEVLVRAQAEDGSTVGAGFTRRDGVAVLRLRKAGTYRVLAQRGGYHDVTVQTVVVGRDGEASVPLRMTQRPFTLDTVTVVARLRNERGRQAFQRRRAMGEGVYLDAEYLRARSPREVTDFLIGVPGIAFQAGREGGIPVTTRGERCMVTLIDGRPVPALTRALPMVRNASLNRAVPLGFDPGDPAARTLNRMVYPDDVVAMEVYREWNEVPLEYRQYAYAPEQQQRCGASLYWTSSRW
ncbi:MAG TPA: carboxypeptidase-like regulatory domain-containing protein [Longimicrobium sp.]|jgi:hypothetical protein|uniref:carboxypeptidase-like regulatory domain-containing protein n=1 Tax=Longimicrobium sp. TaxID=2029185 RepID=UPI002EDB5D4D